MFMENGSVEDMLVSSDSPAKKELVVRMAIEAAKGVIHLHRLDTIRQKYFVCSSFPGRLYAAKDLGCLSWRL